MDSKSRTLNKPATRGYLQFLARYFIRKPAGPVSWRTQHDRWDTISERIEMRIMRRISWMLAVIWLVQCLQNGVGEV
jgi:hypothetical protein